MSKTLTLELKEIYGHRGQVFEPTDSISVLAPGCTADNDANDGSCTSIKVDDKWENFPDVMASYVGDIDADGKQDLLMITALLVRDNYSVDSQGQFSVRGYGYPDYQVLLTHVAGVLYNFEDSTWESSDYLRDNKSQTLFSPGKYDCTYAYLSEDGGRVRVPNAVKLSSNEIQTLLPPRAVRNSYLRSLTKEDQPNGYVLIPAGTALMTSGTQEWDVVPTHTVKFSPFFMGATEVTNGEFREYQKQQGVPENELYHSPSSDMVNDDEAADWDWIMGDLDDEVEQDDDDQPVAGISWSAAANYCSAKGARLPSEDEWQYAATGANGTFKSQAYWLPHTANVNGMPVESTDAFGNIIMPSSLSNYPLSEQKAHVNETPIGHTTYVTSFPGIEFPTGTLYDMDGNVSEWTSTPYYRQIDSHTYSSFGYWYIAKGASYYSTAQIPSARNPLGNGYATGFRCVIPVTE